MTNNLNLAKITLSFILIFILSSCSGYKKLPYLEKAEQLTDEQLLNSAHIYEAKIMPKDVLSIIVNTSSGVVNEYNMPLVPSDLKNAKQTVTQSLTATSGSLQNYIVDSQGKINFPVLGEIKISGLTKSEAEEYISSLIYPQYLTVEKPIVNVRFLSYRVSVLGEVVRPGTYESINDQMTLFDALAAAGDLTIYGKRDNVMLLRTKENGELQVYRINLQDKDILLNSEIYYLQQNDKIYVQTNKARGNSSMFGALESISLSALSVLISVIAIVTR